MFTANIKISKLRVIVLPDSQRASNALPARDAKYKLTPI